MWKIYLKGTYHMQVVEEMAEEITERVIYRFPNSELLAEALTLVLYNVVNSLSEVDSNMMSELIKSLFDNENKKQFN
ncbi:MAG: hypothetical protein QXJ06_04145 [Candidatus Aenigmatarchaeota archaeon]